MYLRVAAALIGFFAFGATGASAGVIPIANSNFENAVSLPWGGGVYGSWGENFSGWQKTAGTAGTWAPLSGNAMYATLPDEIGTQFGYVSSGATVYQTLNYTIESGVDLSLSALIGHRADKSFFQGEMGVFVGTIDNAIASINLSDPGLGQWSLQSLLIDSVLLQAYVGQQLGIFIRVAAGGTPAQLHFDNFSLTAEDLGLVQAKVLVNPLPGAYLLFGSALAFGGFMRRRAKKTQA